MFRKRLWVGIGIALMSLCLNVRGQVLTPYPVPFDHLTTEDGLPQNTAYALLQDSEGFLWIGTEEGLVRYDGNSCEVFSQDADDPNSIGNNWIRDIAEDAAGNIWIGTVDGLYQYVRRKGIFRDYSHLLKKRQQGFLMVSDVFLAKAHNLLFFKIRESDRYDIGCLDIVQNTCRYISLDTIGNGISWTSKSLVQKGNSLYAMGDRKIVEIDLTSLEPQIHDLPKLPAGFLGGGMMPSAGPFIWVANFGHGLWRFNTETLEIQKFTTGVEQIDKGSISVILTDKRLPGVDWIGTDGDGLFRIHGLERARPQIYHFRHNERSPESLANDRITRLLQDRQGRIWVGTSASLDLYQPDREQFKQINSQVLPDLKDNVFLSMRTDHANNLWLGTASGLLRLRPKYPERAWSSFLSLDEAVAEVKVFPQLAGKYVRSLFVDRKGQVWAGSRDGKLSLFSSSGAFKRSIQLPLFPGKPNLHSMVNAMAETQSGELMLANELRISRFSPQKDKLTDLQALFDSCLAGSMGGISPHVLDVKADLQGGYWFATFQGVIHWDAEQECFDLLEPVEEGEIPGKAMALAWGDATQEQLWIGAFGEGLFGYNRRSGEIQHFTEKEGLQNNGVMGLLTDASGKLWMSTNGGISSFDPKTKDFQAYGMEEGLLTNEFNKIAFHQSKQGEMFFGTDKGLVMFMPDSMRQHVEKAPVSLTRLFINYDAVTIDEKLLLTDVISFAEKIRLGPDEKVLSLEFAALDLRGADRRFYAYRLKGFDPDWIYTDARHRRATYSSLPAGTYVFQVKASDTNGNFTSEPVELEIEVIPPFWKRTWFIILSVLALLAIVAGAVRYYSQRKLRAQIREMETQHKIQIERERIARDLHDNIGSKLAYIIYNLDQVADELKNRHPKLLDEQDDAQFAHLNDFARDTISQLRETIWAINKEAVTLEEFESRLQRFLWKHLGNVEGMEFEFYPEASRRIESESEFKAEMTLSPTQALNLFRIVQEAVSNSLKYSGASQIKVRMTLEEGKMLELSVADNGSGFDQEAELEGEHYGLSNMQSRAAEIGGEFRMETQTTSVDSGTKITISLPLLNGK